jgi:RNA polymerase sigma-70 factor (ECF subfamily)
MLDRTPDSPHKDREDRLGTTDRILVEEPFLRRLALRLSRRNADADDLVQETMLRAYRARDRFETGTSMRAWLATILRRLFMTESMKYDRRKTHADSDVGELLATTPGRPGVPSDPSRLTYDAALDHVPDKVKRAFVRLPDTYREPFVLFALDGLSYAEIASHLRIPIGTVMSRIHRARSRLREKSLSTTTSEVA